MSETTANTTSLGALWSKTLSKDPSLLNPVGINEPISNRRNILRNSAGSQLKSKFAYHLECLLEYGDKATSTDWEDFFLLRPDHSIISRFLSQQDETYLLSKKTSLNRLYDRCVERISGPHHPAATSHAMEMLSVLIRGVMSRKFPFPDYDVTTLLMDKSLTDVVISNTLSTLRCIMNIEGEALIPPSIRLLLVMCACTENSETNPFLRYIMEMSLADTLAHVLSIESVIYACHIDIMMIFHILLSYRPADRDNPYVILLNDQPEVLRKLYELIHVTLAEDMGDIKSEKIVPDRTTTGVVNYVYSYFHTPTVFVPSDVPATTVFSITLFSTLYDTLHVNYRHVNAVRDSDRDGRSTTDTHGLRTLLNLLFVLFSRGVHKESALLCHPIVDALSDVTRRNENLDSWSLRVDTMKNGEAVIVEGTVASVITTVLRSYLSSDHEYQDSRLLRKCLVCLYQLSQPEDAETPNLPTIQLELKGKAIDMMYSFAEEEEEDQVLVQWFKDLRVKGRDDPNYTL